MAEQQLGKEDYIFRVALIASDVAVGSSSLLLRFTQDVFTEFGPGVGVDFATRCIKVDGKVIKSHIFDLPGQDRLNSVNLTLYKTLQGVLLVYDITNRKSYERVELRLKDLRSHQYTDNADIVIILVGNMCDLHHRRAVPTDEAMEFARKHSLLFIETSARDSINVTTAFQTLLTEVYYVVVAKSKGQTINEVKSQVMMKNFRPDKMVKVETTILTIHGAPGSGKSSITDLVLGNPPATERNSTLVATSPARSMAGCRISANEYINWERVGTQKLMNLLADSIAYLNEHQLQEPISEQPRAQHEPNKPAVSKDATFSTRLGLERIKSIFCYRSSNIEPQIEQDVPFSSSINKSAVAEHLLSLLSSANASDQLFSAHWIYLIDSGGQPQFQEVLPLFVHHNSINIVTHRLCEELSEKPAFEFVVHGKHTGLPSELQLTNLDMITSLFRSQSSMRASSVQQVEIAPSEPHFALVGTFLDQADSCSESIEKKNQILREVLSPYDHVRIDSDPSKGEIIFPVNAITTEGREELASRLRQLIMSRPEARLVVNVPMKWFVLELELSRIAEEKGRHVLTLDECVEAGELLSIKPNELKAALNYFNSLSMYLYVPECLPDTVFVTFQPVLNKLSTIIAVTFGNAASLLGVSFKPGSLQQLRDKGIFTVDLLHDLPDGFIPTIFTAENFLKLLSFFLVVAPIQLEEETGYFLPCVLHRCSLNYSDKQVFIKNASSWILMWDLKSTPVGLFIAFIVSLLNRNKEPRFSLSRSHQQLRNAIRLSCVDFGGALLIIDHTYWLEVCYSGSASLCPDIRQTVLGSIAHATQRLNYSANMQVGFPCWLCQDPIEHPCIVHCPHDSQHPLQCTAIENKCKVCADPMRYYQLTCSRDETTTGTVTSAHLPWLPHTARQGPTILSSNGQQMPDSTVPGAVTSDHLQWLPHIAQPGITVPSTHEQQMHDSATSANQQVRDSIKQLLTESSVDLHTAMSTDPSSIAVMLYSSSFISDSTMNYVSTAMGVSNHDKAFRVLDDCRSNILSHVDPKKRLREFIVILKDAQPSTRHVATRIEEKLSNMQL